MSCARWSPANFRERGYPKPSVSGSPPAWRKWSGAIGRFLGLQSLVQVLGFAGGIVLVRGLSTESFGLYTVLMSALMTVQILADSGTGSALASIGGGTWSDRPVFSSLVRVVQRFRTRLALAALLIAAPVYGLSALGWRGTLGALLLLPLLGAWVAVQAQVDVRSGALRIAGGTTTAQRIDLAMNVFRLVVLGLIFWLVPAVAESSADGWRLAGALAALLAVLAMQARRLRTALSPWIDAAAQERPGQSTQVRGLIRAQWLYNILYIVQGQLALLLIAASGKAQQVGEFGALARLAAVFTVFNALQTSLILPAFARLAPDPSLLRRRFLQVGAAGLALGVALWWFAWLFPRPLLWLLGPAYLHLESELTWLMAAHATLYVASVLWSLNYARGWVHGSWVIPLASLGVQLATIPLLDLGSTRGALILVFVAALPAIPLNLWLMRRGLSGGSPAP